jgi:hypothetical protein
MNLQQVWHSVLRRAVSHRAAVLLGVALFAAVHFVHGPGVYAQDVEAAVTAETAMAELQGFRESIDTFVADMDRQFGSAAAATETLLRAVPHLTRAEAKESGGWLTYEWTTSIPVEIDVGVDQFSLPSPREYFNRPARTIEDLIAEVRRSGAVPSGLVVADLRRLSEVQGVIRAAFVECRVPGIGSTWLQQRIVDRLLANWRALPDQSSDELARKRPAWQRYDEARRQLGEIP